MIPTRFLLAFGTFLLAVLLYVDRICISTAKSPITTELGLTDEQFGWVLSAFALGYALFQTPSGWLADRFGPRKVVTAVVTVWSLLTGLTAWTRGFYSMLTIRFLFGAGEAGGFPGMARAIYSWIPMKERGLVTGINFSGGRLGAAFALPGIAWMIDRLGWRTTFGMLTGIGLVWALGWFWWFRDDPSKHPHIRRDELALILSQRQQAADTAPTEPLRPLQMLRSLNLWCAMTQYFCSNFTFFFCLTWLFPHLKQTYHLESVSAGWYASAPLIAGALGNVFAGWMVDRIYRAGRWKLSRQLPAMSGFGLAAAGMLVSATMHTPGAAVAWLAIAIFGADMTLAPSWAFCIDIGQKNSGAVSGTMNMAGNLGSFVTSLAFPYLLKWTGNPNLFFFLGAALNVAGALIWLVVQPESRIGRNPTSIMNHRKSTTP